MQHRREIETMSKKEETGDTKKIIVQSSFPICSVTFIVLLILKLIKAIEISWLWVFAPLWIPVALFVAVIVVYFIVMGIGILVALIKGE